MCLLSTLILSICNYGVFAFGEGHTDEVSKRTRFYKMSPALDRVKPLANFNYSGFVLRRNYIYGHVNAKNAVKWDIELNQPKAWYHLDESLSVPMLVTGESVLAATKSGAVYKFQDATGKVLWKAILPAFVSKKMVIDGGFVYALDSAGNLACIELSTGEKKWIRKLDNSAEVDIREVRGLSLSAGNVYVGNVGTVEVFEANTGRKLGKYNVSKYVGKFGAIIGDISFTSNSIVFARHDGWIFSESLDNYSKNRWKHRLPSQISSVVSEGNLIYVGTTRGKLYSIDLNTGKLFWEREIGSAIGGIFVGLKDVYANTYDGLIMSLRRENGALNWSDNLNGLILTSPFVHNKQIFFTTTLGNIYGFKM